MIIYVYFFRNISKIQFLFRIAFQFCSIIINIVKRISVLLATIAVALANAQTTTPETAKGKANDSIKANRIKTIEAVTIVGKKLW